MHGHLHALLVADHARIEELLTRTTKDPDYFVLEEELGGLCDQCEELAGDEVENLFTQTPWGLETEMFDLLRASGR